MRSQTKNRIRNQARVLYGLVHILREDVDVLRINANECLFDSLDESIIDINATLSKINNTLADIERELYSE